MQINEVATRRDIKEFIDFPKILYKSDPFWVCPLDTEINGFFNPAKNHAFRHGVATRWILKDEDGKTIGRIACIHR